MREPRHIKATVQYDGTGYSGFQLQGDLPTIQRELEAALSFVAGHDVRILGAGRTDAGVHARGQVISFGVRGTIPTERLPEAANSALPGQIVVWDATEVDAGFHPRYGAKSKIYSYSVWRGQRLSPFVRNYVYHYPTELSLDRLMEAGECLKGRHDFKAFRASGSSVKTTVRTIHGLNVVQEESSLLRFWIEADGFLYNMVRIIVGTLLEVGRGRFSAEDVRQALATGERGALGPTAPPHGLCLEQVRYC